MLNQHITSNRTSLELKLRTCAIAAHVRVSSSNRATAVSTKILSVRVVPCETQLV